MIKLKKTYLIIVGIILTILLGTILYFTLKPKENNLIEIDGTELLKKLENKETFILVFTQTGCVHCSEYKPILNRVLTENNIKAYEINRNNLEKEEETIKNKVNELFNINGTPMTLFINDGEEKTTINRISGSTNYTNLKNILKERGFIE